MHFDEIWYFGGVYTKSYLAKLILVRVSVL